MSDVARMPPRGEILFVHQGKECAGGAESIPLIPMGVFAMAGYLDKHGIRSRIIHSMIEKKIDGGFDLLSRIKKYGARILCFDLHWHQQTTDVLRVVRDLKKKGLRVPVVLGGHTASFFHKQIMEKYQEVDFIIRGDAEVPLLGLSRFLILKKGRLPEIPNLVYRSGRTVRCNAQTYCTTSGMFDKLDFTRFDLLEHHEFYVKPGVFEGNISAASSDGSDSEGGTFFYNCGRGCPYNCSICGGSRVSQRVISNRKGIVYAPPDAVVRSLAGLKKFGIRTWYNTFDPSKNKGYFIGLFKKIRGHKMRLNLCFEFAHLPGRDFIRAAEKTFEEVRFEFVIQTGSESVRRRNKENFYSNREFIDVLRLLRTSKIRVNLCFVAGLPFEKKENVVESLTFVNYVRRNFPRVSIVAKALEMEPASPCHMDSASYGIINQRATLEDFLQDHRKEDGLGYRTEHFTAPDIRSIESYYVREAACRRTVSLFLEHISSVRGPGRFDLRRAYRFCEECSYSRDCFPKKMNPWMFR